MLGVPPPNRDRFLAAIAERVSPDRVQKLYLFAPIRQGAIETGVAVLACDPLPPPELVNEAGVTAAREGAAASEEPISNPQSPISNLQSAVPPIVRTPTPSNATEYPRPVVLTARYRHTLKGADRGKWEFDVHEQADAPLASLERVIQGVQHRLAEAIEPELVSVDALRAALADGVWTPPAR